MNKTIIAVASIIAVTTIVCFYMYTQNNRFISANAGGGKVYKIDKRTGNSFLILGRKELPVVPIKKPKIESNEEKAILLAKSAKTLDFNKFSNNETIILEQMEKLTGDLNIIGWKAKKINENIYLATYAFDQGKGNVIDLVAAFAKTY